MARTQAVDYDEKRQLISTKAAELFARQGAASASLANVAAACKMSKSLIYHYYDSKEEVLFDVMDSHMEELLSIIVEIEEQNHAGGEHAFQAFSEALLTHYVGAADHQKVLLYELDNLPPESKATIVDKERQLISFAEELLLRAIGSDIAAKAILKSRIMLFFGMLNWTHSWFNPDGAVGRRDLARMASSATLQGAMHDIESAAG